MEVTTDFEIVEIKYETKYGSNIVVFKDAYVSSLKISEIFNYDYKELINIIESYYNNGFSNFFDKDYYNEECDEYTYFINYDGLLKIFPHIKNDGRNEFYKIECLISVGEFIEKNNLKKRW